jgi:hypothetical protein
MSFLRKNLTLLNTNLMEQQSAPSGLCVKITSVFSNCNLERLKLFYDP